MQMNIFPKAIMPWLNLVYIPPLLWGPQTINHLIKLVEFICNVYLFDHDKARLSSTWVVSIFHFKPLSNF